MREQVTGHKRSDIQALRGVAVLFVLLDHAGVWPFRNGFLGVDVFFVISGYLITGIIARQMQAGTFTFAGFYARRARRILPAAYVTIALTAIGSIWFLDSVEMESLAAQVAGGFTYTINFVLLGQTGYFDTAAASKPLLHLWSLGVEEQFYILYPAFFYLIPPRRWVWAIAGVTVASLIACLAIAPNSPAVAFYLLPTRAWELGLGALGAFVFDDRIRRVVAMLFWPSVVVGLTLAVWSTGLPHPGLDALLICVATLVIIVADNRNVAGSLPVRGLARIGDVSYSLYLVHWPVLVFLRSSYMGPVPEWLALCSLAVTAVLAVAMYFGIERPFLRVDRFAPRLVAGAAGATVLVAAVPLFAAAEFSPTPDYAYLRRPNYGLDRACDASVFKPEPPCITASAPEILIWGDSYAMHTVAGIVERAGSRGIVQATFSACPSILGAAPEVRRFGDPQEWAGRCIAFNRSVLDYLQHSPSIKTVVLASSYGPIALGLQPMLDEGPDGALVPRNPDAAYLADTLGNTVRVVTQLGKKAVVIGPPPGEGNGTDACVERKLSGKLTFGPGRDCLLSEADVDKYLAPLNRALDEIRDRYGAQVPRIADALCFDGYCHGLVDGVSIYRGDSGHLSYDGSREVMRRLQIERFL